MTCKVCADPHAVSDANGGCKACAAREIRTQNTCSACPAGEIQQNNACVACPSDQIASGNSCVACPGFQIANKATNTCVDCPAGQIKSGNACVACPTDRISQNNACVQCLAFGQGANKVTNSCADCPADAVINGGQIQSTGISVTVRQSVSHAANDFCPNQFWVKVNNITSALPGFAVSAALETPLTGSACKASIASENFMTLVSGAWVQFGGTLSGFGVPCINAGPLNTCYTTCDYPSSSRLIDSNVNGGAFRVQGVATGGSSSITVNWQGLPPK